MSAQGSSRKDQPPPVDGLLIVDKPAGWTSHDVVRRVRRLARQRKVGHAGTLDPMATGVLLLGLGRATRLLGHLAAHDKDYVATMRLGQTTVTDDAEGDVDGGADASAVTEEQVIAAMAQFTGAIDQVPSTVSAIKVDGARAYKLVRAGEEVVLASRPVVVERFDALGFRRVDDPASGGSFLDVDVAVTCSTGTYVRALARDVGRELGVGGHLTALRRTRVGGFGIDQAADISADVSDVPGENLDVAATVQSIGSALAAGFVHLVVEDPDRDAVIHGRSIDVPAELVAPGGVGSVPFDGTGVVAVVDADGQGLAIVEQRDGAMRPLVVFV